MKSIFFLQILVVAIMLTNGCNKEEGEKRITLTMINENKEGSIGLRGDGTATIDWGDGRMKEEITLLGTDVGEYYDVQHYEHKYGSLTEFTITITGETITGLFCNNIKTLDVSHNPALTYLLFESTQIISLNLKNNRALKHLEVYSPLTSLDLRNNRELIILRLSMSNNHPLKSLDVSYNTALTELYCPNRQLTSLDVSKNTALRRLNCSGNQLTADALNALFSSLHNNDIVGGKYIQIHGNPGSAACDRSIATSKGWIVDGLR